MGVVGYTDLIAPKHLTATGLGLCYVMVFVIGNNQFFKKADIANILLFPHIFSILAKSQKIDGTTGITKATVSRNIDL